MRARVKATTTATGAPLPDRITIMKIALEAQLDPRTVRRAIESGIEKIKTDFGKARLRDALKKMKLEGLVS